jgi:hypothetical protein
MSQRADIHPAVIDSGLWNQEILVPFCSCNTLLKLEELLPFFYFYFYLVLVSACKQHQKKTSSCVDFKNQGKKSAKTRKLGFLRNDCALGRAESRKPTKNQGEIQGSRKPKCFGWPKKRTKH